MKIPRHELRRLLALIRAARLTSSVKQTGVLLQPSTKGIDLWVITERQVLRLFVPGRQRNAGDAVVLPFEALVNVQSKSQSPVTVEPQQGGRVVLRWQDRGQNRTHVCEPKDELPSPPRAPRRWQPAEADLLGAMREAMATTTDEPSRFALDHLQLRGRSGEIIATDARQILRQGGFTFPWRNNVLVAASRVFQCKELRESDSLRVAQSKEHLFLECGSITIGLRIEQQRRFPEVDPLLPAQGACRTQLVVAEEDARKLQDLLPRLPADQDPDRPVTLHLQKKPEVVGYDEKTDRAESVALTDSRLKGPKLQVSLNRGYWLRALELGFRRFGFRESGDPVAAYDGQRQYVWSVLEGVPQPTATIRSAPGNRHVSENAEEHDLPDSEEPTPVDEAGEIQFRLRQTIDEAQQLLKRLDRQQQPRRRGRQRVGI